MIVDEESRELLDDSCRATSPTIIPLQAVVFGCDAPVDHAAEISRRSSMPVIFDVYEQLEHPALLAFVSAVTAPTSASASAMATTNFETNHKLDLALTSVLE